MHFVIIGGVSVNDKTHDKFPFNFLNGGFRKGKSLSGEKTAVVFAPSYELRATNQKKEHPKVKVVQNCTSHSVTVIPLLYSYEWKSCENDKRHFLNIARKSAAANGMKYREIRKAHELTDILKGTTGIESIHFFGHSNAANLFLEYGAVVSAKSTVTWGESDAKKVPAANFKKNAVFSSYGCNQGDKGGLAEKLHGIWGITTVGSEGKTDFSPIGQGKTHPTSAGGYYKYDGGGRTPVTITN